MSEPSPGAPGFRVETAVGAIVTRSAPGGLEILLVRRGRGAGRGLWSVPGGRVEPGERLAEAVVREVAEETGLEVVVERFVGWVERIDTAGEWHYVILDFQARPTDPEALPHAGDDAADAAWVAISSLATVGSVELVPGLLAFLAEHGFVEQHVVEAGPEGPGLTASRAS